MQIARGSNHPQEQDGDEPEIQDRHDPALRARDFVITLFFLGPFAKQRVNPWQRCEEYKPDDEIPGTSPTEPNQNGESG